jgi:hypothetical protein
LDAFRHRAGDHDRRTISAVATPTVAVPLVVGLEDADDPQTRLE